MLKHYLMLGTKVLLRRKFFTFVSLFGISFTLLVLMVATALLDHQFGVQAPETYQNRTLQVDVADMRGEGHESCCSPGFKLLDRYARNLPGVERLSLFTSGGTVYSYINGRKIESWIKRTDGEFWKILQFTFLEGGPYSSQDLDEARFVAVINDSTRRAFFDTQSAVGRTIEATGQTFRVIGVVADVSAARSVPYADIWVPYTTTKSPAYRNQLIGNFRGLVLGRDPASLPQIREEFNARLARAELDDPKLFTRIVAPLDTKFDAFTRRTFVADTMDPERQGWKFLALLAIAAVLFALLPTVNLMNLGISRIMERQSEIGVRKAFGACSHTLLGQFIVENILLTTVGGALGSVFSIFVLRSLNASGVIQYAHLTFNIQVFTYGVILTLAFALISGVYPAWRMSRVHPIDALRGGTRR
jgi:putative ABC transport system permease protein